VTQTDTEGSVGRRLIADVAGALVRSATIDAATVQTDVAILHALVYVCSRTQCSPSFLLFRNSQLSTLYDAVKSRTEMTIVTTP